MPRLRLETQDRDKNHEFGFNEWSENMITMPEHLASISAFGPARIMAGTLYAQGELAGARKLEEQMLEALAPDMKAHGGGGEVGELSQVAALGDGENDVEMLKES